MCYLVQLGVPVRYAAAIESPRAFRVVPQDNPSVRAAMGEAFATFGIEHGGCSCGIYTSPKAARDPQDRHARKREEYRRRGWSEAKIERAMADASDAAERHRSTPGLRQDVVQFIAHLLNTVGEARLIAHWYHGRFSEEHVPAIVAKRISVEELRHGIALDEDTLYTITGGMERDA